MRDSSHVSVDLISLGSMCVGRGLFALPTTPSMCNHHKMIHDTLTVVMENFKVTDNLVCFL